MLCLNELRGKCHFCSKMCLNYANPLQAQSNLTLQPSNMDPWRQGSSPGPLSFHLCVLYYLQEEMVSYVHLFWGKKSDTFS